MTMLTTATASTTSDTQSTTLAKSQVGTLLSLMNTVFNTTEPNDASLGLHTQLLRGVSSVPTLGSPSTLSSIDQQVRTILKGRLTLSVASSNGNERREAKNLMGLWHKKWWLCDWDVLLVDVMSNVQETIVSVGNETNASETVFVSNIKAVEESICFSVLTPINEMSNEVV